MGFSPLKNNVSVLVYFFILLPLSLFLIVQGHSRRVQVAVKPVQHSGTLPLMVEAILSVSIGCVTARSTKLQRGLDSYQVGLLNIEILKHGANLVFQ